MPDLEKMRSEGVQIPPRFLSLLQQVEDGANFSKYGLFMFPPADAKEKNWLTAGNVIMEVMTLKMKDPQVGIDDIKAIELAVTELPQGKSPFVMRWGN